MNRSILFAKPREITWGWCYLAFQSIFLGYFLILGVQFLNLPWGGAQINFLYFCINLAVSAGIFRKFLANTYKAALDRIGTVLLVAVGGFVAYFILTAIVSSLILAIEPDFSNVNDQNISDISRDHYVLTTIGTVFLVPTAEELLHRGAVFGGLYRKNRVVAYLVSIILFALVHISGYIGYFEPKLLALCFLQYVPAGLCLAASYEVSGCIVTPILIHTAVNAIGMLAMR